MAKWCDLIGYMDSVEIRPGVWSDDLSIVELRYFGEMTRNRRKYQSANQLNDDLTISNELSILGDPYAYQNFHKIRYVVYMNTKWKVTDVAVQYPRLILTLGGVYNGSDGPGV